MSLNDGSRQRRRGPELEQALLEAAWDELSEKGYAGFTVDGVARRAGTSRAVLYRRWDNKRDLVLDAIRRSGPPPAEPADTGSLRGDLLALMTRIGDRVGHRAGVLTIGMAAYYTETGTTIADLRRLLFRGSVDIMSIILARAAARGEVSLDRITPRMASLGIDLVRHEVVLTGQRPDDAFFEEIVDTIVLPVLTGRAAAREPELSAKVSTDLRKERS